MLLKITASVISSKQALNQFKNIKTLRFCFTEIQAEVSINFDWSPTDAVRVNCAIFIILAKSRWRFLGPDKLGLDADHLLVGAAC